MGISQISVNEDPHAQSLPPATISTIRVKPAKSSSSNVLFTVESRSKTPIVRDSPLIFTVNGMTISDFVSPSQASHQLSISLKIVRISPMCPG